MTSEPKCFYCGLTRAEHVGANHRFSAPPKTGVAYRHGKV